MGIREEEDMTKYESVSPTSSATKKAEDKTMATINLVAVAGLLRAIL